MTDAQMITLAVAILAVFAGTIFNNSRISDLRSSMDSRISDLGSSVDSRINDLRSSMDSRLGEVDSRLGEFKDSNKSSFESVNRHIDDKFTLLSQQMKTMEDNIMRVLADHETRIQRFESNKP